MDNYCFTRTVSSNMAMEAGKDPGEIRDVPSGNDSQFAIENRHLPVKNCDFP